MADVMKTREYECQIGENETLGLVFPVYYWGLPTVVVSFLNRLKLSGEKPYVWAVITCGSGIGAADRQLKSVGKRVGIPVDAVFSLVMPDNFVPCSRLRGRRRRKRSSNRRTAAWRKSWERSRREVRGRSRG